MSHDLQSPALKPYNNCNLTYFVNGNTAEKFINFVSSSTFLNDIKILFQNPSDYVTSIRVYPFDFTKIIYSSFLKLSVINLNGIKVTSGSPALSLMAYRLKTINDEAPNRVPLSIQLGEIYFNMGSSFLDYAPYTKIELWLPFIGFIPLDTNLVCGKHMSIKYYIDFNIGAINAYLSILDTHNEWIDIYTATGSIGADVPFGSSGAAELARNVLYTGASLAVGAVGVSSNIKRVSTRKKSGGYRVTKKRTATIEQGIDKEAEAAIDDLSSLSLTYSYGTAGNFGAFFGEYRAFARITTPKILYPSNYNHTYGRPLMQTMTLKTLVDKGYTEISDVHVENIKNATCEELDSIESVLKSGVIL